MMIDLPLLTESLPLLLRGAIVSMQIAICASVIGIVFGGFLGIAHTSFSKWKRKLVTVYVSIFRGTPMLIQIFFVFYVLPQAGVVIPALWSATIAIGLNSAAYISQIVRSGINAVPQGQLEAAKTLGMTSWQSTRQIILPQAIRIILPALGNEFVTLVKDSSLASIIGVVELSKEASIIRSRTYDAFTVLLAVSLIYLVITSALSLLISYFETRMKHRA